MKNLLRLPGSAGRVLVASVSLAALSVGLGRAVEPGGEQAAALALFNGSNLDGWVIEHGGRFSVENGVLSLDRGKGWLRSAETFGDFTLVIEFRFLEANANSGIFVRTAATCRNDDSGWPDNGYQIQCMDTLEGAHPLATLIPYGAPEPRHASDLEALRRAYRPTGEWHTFEITCRGEEMAVRLNGETITTCTGLKNPAGHIGIQGENGRLEFRRIEVRKL